MYFHRYSLSNEASYTDLARNYLSAHIKNGEEEISTPCALEQKTIFLEVFSIYQSKC
jgi:hypothetical protein